MNSRSARVRRTMASTKRCHHTTAFKWKVVLEAEGPSNLQAQRNFVVVDEKNVCQWRKQRNNPFSCTAQRTAFTRPKNSQHHEVQKDVASFIRKQKESGVPVTTEITQVKMRETASFRGIVCTQFKASWVTHFISGLGSTYNGGHLCAKTYPPTSKRR